MKALKITTAVRMLCEMREKLEMRATENGRSLSGKSYSGLESLLSRNRAMKSSRHKKTPTLAGDGALVNEINFEEEIVMSDISTAVAKSNVIPFRSTKLLLVERDSQAFVPMKPVVEGWVQPGKPSTVS